MKVLVTGGAGFIGRWVVHRLLSDGAQVTVLDDLSNGSLDNLAEFRDHSRYRFVRGDIRDASLMTELFGDGFDTCIHLAAQINVQHSIDDPQPTFDTNVAATFGLMQEANKTGTKVVFVSSILVYAAAEDGCPIDEFHPVKAASPYAGSKIAGEQIALSYYYAYGLPVVVLRPASVYGPYQRTDAEGGVVSIFLQRALRGETLQVFGDGTQTRDFLYVADCVDFILRAAESSAADGHILNAGTGSDISIAELAALIGEQVRYVPHPHPQSETSQVVVDSSRARQLLGWMPQTRLSDGLQHTERWLRARRASQPQ